MTDLAPRELRVLVAVAEQGGFSAAAVTLGMTQSAVSHSVRGSERRLGAVLFDRGRSGAVPTPAGERALGYARRVLRLLEVMGSEGATGPAAALRAAGVLPPPSACRRPASVLDHQEEGPEGQFMLL